MLSVVHTAQSERNIHPAGELVGQVPSALTVPHEDEEAGCRRSHSRKTTSACRRRNIAIEHDHNKKGLSMNCVVSTKQRVNQRSHPVKNRKFAPQGILPVSTRRADSEGRPPRTRTRPHPLPKHPRRHAHLWFK